MAHLDNLGNCTVIQRNIPIIPHYSDVPQIGFKNGLEAVTSYNYYNWISKKRYTYKV